MHITTLNRDSIYRGLFIGFAVLAALFLFAAAAQAAQFARPDTDIVIGSWSGNPINTTGNVYQNIDEASANDADFIRSENDPVQSEVEFALSDVGDPLSSGGHVLRYRYRRGESGGGKPADVNLTVELRQGSSVIASQTHSSIVSGFNTGSFTLSSSEADSITDYTDLRLRFRATKTQGHRTVWAEISRAELEVPSIQTNIDQSAYRWFEHADSTDVGPALASQDSAATLNSSGQSFRLRMLAHVGAGYLGISDRNFTLQFSEQSGDCDSEFSGEDYVPVTASTPIAFGNNTPLDGVALTANSGDPVHNAHVTVNQTYEEENTFTNSQGGVSAGEDAMWDFALMDNGAPANTSYCFRMTSAWDVASVGYDTSVSTDAGGENLPTGVTFNSDGTKMYVVGIGNDSVYEYALSTPWDVGSATHQYTFSIGSEDGSPEGIDFSSDGTVMYIAGDTSDAVHQYGLSVPWDLSTAAYQNKSKNVSAQETFPFGIDIKNDGTKMYINGLSNRVYQYTLATPWDVSTASYDAISVDTSGQTSIPEDVTFSTGGEKMYIIENGANESTVVQYELATPWDVSSAVYNGVSADVGSETSFPTDVTFAPDGSTMYIAHNDPSSSSGDAVLQYSLSLNSYNVVPEITTASSGGTPTNQPPIADAGPDQSGTVGEALTFDGSMSGDADGSIVSYEWDFGDGATATGTVVTHAYSSPGDYTAILTVTDDGGLSSVDTVTVTIVEDQPTDDTLSVDSITYTTEGGRTDDKHLNVVLGVVDGSNQPAQDASVIIDLYLEGVFYESRSGATLADGTVVFNFKNTLSGCYGVVVTSVVKSGFMWDGTTPANSYCK